MPSTYITTTIPYVNARPHLGHALEFVQADVLARHYRRLGNAVRFQTGTDDNSLKNVLAAQAVGVPVQEFVDANAGAFTRLAGQLSLSVDDVINTSSDARHQPGVERLWRACDKAGDLYRKYYEGLYCVGCEQFYQPDELVDGRCPEHGTVPDLVSEENWFFRLSKYAGLLREQVASGALRIEPRGRRNEVLAFIDSGLADFSVSRSAARARGWGIPVPGDPGQVIYVWFDALGNYITALGYGTDPDQVERWWSGASRRIHLLGKGVLRFHAVYWPAILASAGLPLPTDIFVHDYLTVDGRKISKSGGNTVDPAALAADYGTDALRWWLLRDVPRVGDADFTVPRLLARYHDELVNGIGNLVNRTVAMVHRYRAGAVPATDEQPPDWQHVAAACERAVPEADAALGDADFRRATAAVWAVAEQANRYVSQTAPWTLARAEETGDRTAARHLDAVLAALIGTCRDLAVLLEPYLPDAAARITAQCDHPGGRLPPPAPVFNRHTPARSATARLDSRA
jgi:methionyl-tRNA synthetase